MRNNNFNIIRFLAAIMVMSGHQALISQTNLPIMLKEGIHIIGVRIFFIVGGYLITKSWLSSHSVKEYAKKRLFRILPPLILYTLICVLLIAPFLTYLPIKEYFMHPVTWRYFKNILFNTQYFLPGIFENNPYPNVINGSLWTLPVECALYVLLPLSLSFIVRKNFKRALYLTIFVSFLQFVHLVQYPTWRFVVYNTDIAQAMTLIPYYFMGMLWTFPELKNKCSITASFVFVCIFLCCELPECFMELLLLVLLPYLIFSVAFSKQLLISKWLDKFEITYEIYLYSFFIQQTVVYILLKYNILLNSLLIFIISLFFTFIISYVTHVFISKLFLYFKIQS